MRKRIIILSSLLLLMLGLVCVAPRHAGQKIEPPAKEEGAPDTQANQQGFLNAALGAVTRINHVSAMSLTLALFLAYVVFAQNKTTRLLIKLSHERELRRIECIGCQHKPHP